MKLEIKYIYIFSFIQSYLYKDINKMQEVEQDNYQVTINLQATPIDQKYYIFPQVLVNQQVSHKLVRQSYIFFVIQLRTGVTEDILKNITNYIVESCEQILVHGLKGISFVINGQHHEVKKLNIPSIRQMLQNVMNITQNDDYFDTLQKTRHAIQRVAQRLDQTRISLIFFLSYVQIDHSLGVKKRSYIDQLNQHSEMCSEQIVKMSKAIRRYTDQCKTYIISLDKNGQELEDYSLADTQIMNEISMGVGNYGSVINRNYSQNQLSESFRSVTSLVLIQLYSMTLLIPKLKELNNKAEIIEILLQCNDMRQFKASRGLFVPINLFDIDKANKDFVRIANYKKLEEKLDVVRSQVNFIYKEVDGEERIILRASLYSQEIGDICWKLSQEIVSYKRRYAAGKSYLQMLVNEKLLLELRERINLIYDISKDLHNEISESKYTNKHKLYENYSELKSKIDTVQEILLGVFKKQIGGSEIGRLSQVISLSTIKKSIKNKLIRRINGNPYLLDQVYKNIRQIVESDKENYAQLEVDCRDIRYNLGNCILSDYNLIKAMRNSDALGLAFEIQRPQSAIVDPGRIKIRQISPFLMRTSQFFEKFMYKIEFTPNLIELTLGKCSYCKSFKCKASSSYRYIIKAEVLSYQSKGSKINSIQWNNNPSSNSFSDSASECLMINSIANFESKQLDYLRFKGQLQKDNYKERWDYTDSVARKQTVLGFMPLYLTAQHWKIGKQLMKPSLAWTATGQPLGYLYSQYQTIPFMVLSNLIRQYKQKQYQIQEQQKKVDACKNEKQLNSLETQLNSMRKRLQRMKHILRATEQTCRAIMIDKSDNSFIEEIFKQYTQYENPINRTIDVIKNNSAFISQLYCAFKYQLLPKPKEDNFHQFFLRLVEEELRRETDGWNEQQTQDHFIDKLLNVETREMNNMEFNIVGGEEYLNDFMLVYNGENVKASYVQLQKKQLAMMLKKQGKFNDSQRLLIIEYKRLYQNRVLWLWYVRFLLYGQLERIVIHKWKCLGLKNSYMLFTLIIQNKKQRKNFKRRQAILNGQYADPFNYQQAHNYLEKEFIELRSKKEGELLKSYAYKVCTKAASIFSQTFNLEQAAGTLLNFCDRKIPSYYEQLRQGRAVRVDQKLRMLLNGEHRGVHLFQGWKMNRQKYERLRKVYPIQFMRFQYKF